MKIYIKGLNRLLSISLMLKSFMPNFRKVQPILCVHPRCSLQKSAHKQIPARCTFS
uniref:Uncharacterized protein n=1 Tax=Rhizophora mucronata TaxID=61149 RepID=A0A2P2IQN1_RHIMU